MAKEKQVYYSKIWYEEAEADNPFAAKATYCHGYNVTADILPKASWSEYLYLLFTGERATVTQAELLEKIAVALANPGMRDLSVRAAMNSGVGGSTAASCLFSAIAVGAGKLGGGREVYTLVKGWHKYGQDVEKWSAYLKAPNKNRSKAHIWPNYEHPPGFDPNGDKCPTTIVETLDYLVSIAPDGPLQWLQQHRQQLEQTFGLPLAITAVIAAGFHQLGIRAKESEMLFLMLRLPGAAVHAIEQEGLGWKKFPFFGDHTELTDDPGSQGLPKVKGYNA